MRGIAGIIHFDSSLQLPDVLPRMLNAMALGQTLDHSGILHERGGHLAYAAQHLIPTDLADLQPLRTQRTIGILVTIAYLRNHEELALDFGWSQTEAATKPDSAFVLAAFERWGDSSPAHLEGSFAMAVWQPREQRFFCAVSDGGAHPIYYWQEGKRFIFASSLGGLFAHPDIPRRLNAAVFAEQFANIPADSADTLYHGIRRVRYGHALVIGANGAIHTHPYRVSAPPTVLRLRSDGEYIEAMRSQLTAAVRRSLRTLPGNVGLLLSGGLDSSSVAAIAGQILADEGRRLQAIHIVPQQGNRYQIPLLELDESAAVRSLQAHAPHIDFHFTTANSQPASREAWDDYFTDNFAPFESLLSSDADIEQTLQKLDISLLIDGVGGNHVVSLEALASGYLAHLAISGRWPAWWREARGHRRVYGRSLRFLARHAAINPIKRVLRGRPAPRSATRTIDFLHPSLRASTKMTERFDACYDYWSRPKFDFRSHLHEIINVWQSLYVGTPASVFSRQPARRIYDRPLFDRRLAEFCLSLPFDQQVRDGWDRRLLREAMRGMLPEDVRLRVKRGYPQPEFQRNFSVAKPMLKEELDRMGSSSMVREFLDYDRLLAHWQLCETQPTLNHELVLVKGIVAGAFLRWHERLGT